MPSSNQYQAKLETLEGHYRVSLLDGEDEVFSTTLIPARYKLVADMIHSTLEVAIAFGFFQSTQNED